MQRIQRATRWRNSRTVNEYGYLMDNLSEAAWFCSFRSVFWAASFRSTGEVCPKEAVFLFRVLARGVGARLVIALICGCVG